MLTAALFTHRTSLFANDLRRGARKLDALKTFVEEQATQLLGETTESGFSQHATQSGPHVLMMYRAGVQSVVWGG